MIVFILDDEDVAKGGANYIFIVRCAFLQWMS
jgi:hypothetical protein